MPTQEIAPPHRLHHWSRVSRTTPDAARLCRSPTTDPRGHTAPARRGKKREGRREREEVGANQGIAAKTMAAKASPPGNSPVLSHIFNETTRAERLWKIKTLPNEPKGFTYNALIGEAGPVLSSLLGPGGEERELAADGCSVAGTSLLSPSLDHGRRPLSMAEHSRFPMADKLATSTRVARILSDRFVHSHSAGTS